MNALLIILALIALSGFKPKDSGAVGTKPDQTGNTDKGQVTQGYYSPFGNSNNRRKMNTKNAVSIGTDDRGRPKMMSDAVEPNTYYVGWSARFENGRLIDWTEPKLVYLKHEFGGSSSFGEFNPDFYEII